MVLGAVDARKVCHHCGKPGHFKRDCWKLNGAPAHVKKGNNKGTKPLPPPPSKNWYWVASHQWARAMWWMKVVCWVLKVLCVARSLNLWFIVEQAVILSALTCLGSWSWIFQASTCIMCNLPMEACCIQVASVCCTWIWGMWHILGYFRYSLILCLTFSGWLF